jgi:hypothetical protein
MAFAMLLAVFFALPELLVNRPESPPKLSKILY